MKSVLSFIIGAAVSSAVSVFVSSKIFKKKYELVAQKEIEEYKEYVKKNILRGDSLEEHDRKIVVDAINDFLDKNGIVLEKLTYDDVCGISRDGAILYSNEPDSSISEDNLTEEEKEEMRINYAKLAKEYGYEDEDDDEELIKAVRAREKKKGVSYDSCNPDIQVITEEEFETLVGGDTCEYDTETVYYQYEENVFMNMGGNIVDEDDLGGLDMFVSYGVGDIIYIKNKSAKILYEVEIV